MEAARDLTCGCIGGMLAKIVESPFDTVKVRLQHSPGLYTSNADCARRIFRQAGVCGFFRGLPAPMVAGGMENAVSFATFGSALTFISRMRNSSQGCGEDHSSPRGATEDHDLPLLPPLCSVCPGDGTLLPPSLLDIVCAGAFSGFCCSFTLTPLELVKCTLQVQDILLPEQRQYRGVADCLLQQLRSQGVTGVYRGHTATMCRETPGNAAFFGFYNISKRMFATGPGETAENLPFWKILLAGGFGGVGYWTAFFPADVVKTKMQTSAEFQQMGLWRGMGYTYRTQGVAGLYAGWGITVVRAFPANALVFTTYEYLSMWWDNAIGVVSIEQQGMGVHHVSEVGRPHA